ncbi:hypothetical protein RvY_07433 [Ramazzottius varieornatus]|uniref:Uncharacterized protein n=1 Tax=Ramazzottius varieornatus TaxID=947166 RepID=A0A1D1V2C5_RAMVA|nr:hypothetical protein RvY_07433 [Ramazzottius varieornatus]
MSFFVDDFIRTASLTVKRRLNPVPGSSDFDISVLNYHSSQHGFYARRLVRFTSSMHVSILRNQVLDRLGTMDSKSGSQEKSAKPSKSSPDEPLFVGTKEPSPHHPPTAHKADAHPLSRGEGDKKNWSCDPNPDAHLDSMVHRED